MINKKVFGHFLAIITILFWGTTFVSTKTLLTNFSPEEILSYRFFGAFIILVLIYPRNIKFLSIKEEFLFFLLGIFGVTLYYWTENLALKYSSASNVGLIVSSIPIFTALVAHFMIKDEKFTSNLLIGFITAIIGIVIVIFNEKTITIISVGDFFAVISALSFSFYSVLIKKVGKNYNHTSTVQKIFFYGVLTILPIFIISHNSLPKPSELTTEVILNLLFLTIFASLLCFIMWNKAISIIGSVKATNYIYLVPLITLISSVAILHEKVTISSILGGFLIFIGILINESKWIANMFKINTAKTGYVEEKAD